MFREITEIPVEELKQIVERAKGTITILIHVGDALMDGNEFSKKPEYPLYLQRALVAIKNSNFPLILFVRWDERADTIKLIQNANALPTQEVVIVPTYYGRPVPILTETMDERKWAECVVKQIAFYRTYGNRTATPEGYFGLLGQTGINPDNFKKFVDLLRECKVSRIFLGGEFCGMRTVDSLLQKGANPMSDESQVKGFLGRRKRDYKIIGLGGKELADKMLDTEMPMMHCVGTAFLLLNTFLKGVEIIPLPKAIAYRD